MRVLYTLLYAILSLSRLLLCLAEGASGARQNVLNSQLVLLLLQHSRVGDKGEIPGQCS